MNRPARISAQSELLTVKPWRQKKFNHEGHEEHEV